MSLLVTESCGWCTTTADLAKKWNLQNNITFAATDSRRGGPAFTGSGGVGRSVPSSAGPYILGQALKPGDMSLTAGVIFQFKEGNVTHVDIVINSNGSVSARRAASTVIGTSASGLFQQGVYAYVEAKVLVHDSTGTVHVRVNGSEVLALTGQDTRNAQTGVIDGVLLMGHSSGSRMHDYYVADTTGSQNNDFLGDVRVDYLAPNAAGNYTQWTPSAGSNFQNVDDSDPDDDTTYNETDVANEKDSYQHASLTALTTEDIKGVIMHCIVKKSDAGDRTLRHGVRSNTTEEVSSFVALSTGYEYRQREYNIDPHTSAAWTKANVDALETLVEVGNP